jgi:hypothetical protein
VTRKILACMRRTRRLVLTPKLRKRLHLQSVLKWYDPDSPSEFQSRMDEKDYRDNYFGELPALPGCEWKELR